MNHKHVVYPPLWTSLWIKPMRALKPARVVALVLLLITALALGFFYGFVRAFIAVALGAVIVWIGGRYLQSVITAPKEPEVTDVADFDLRYVCTMCGLELKVEKAAKDRAPTHCMEKMVLVGEAPTQN